MLVALAVVAVCMSPPVDGPVIADFAPVGRYGGHWGVDYSAVVGEPVRAPVSGTVTFAGSVAGMRTITIEPVSGFKVSLSYLSEVRVSSGSHVSLGTIVGLAGAAHGTPGVHMSTRINGRYVDPEAQMECQDTDISRALRLVEPPRSYPRGRANRNPRWNLRPNPRRPSPHRRVRVASSKSGPRADNPGR